MSLDCRSTLLNSWIPSPCYYRPFVCGAGGFPEQHNVLIIGREVATDLDTNWWSYWDAETGFEYDRFIADYVARRAQMGVQALKSPTRQRYDRIRARGIKAVETSSSKGDGDDYSNRNVVKVLIQKMENLKAVIAHGRIAHRLIDHFASKGVIRIPDEYIFRVERMYNASDESIDNICEKIELEDIQGSKAPG